MKALLACGLALALTPSIADAALMKIIGTPGAGFVTIELSGTTRPSGSGTIRDTTFNDYNTTDSFELTDSILDASIQDTVFAVTGNLSISFNGTTASIDGIFLDQDPSFNSNPEQFSDFGFRSDSGLAYSVLPGQALTYAGTGTINVDINAFSTPYNQTAAFSVPMFASNEFTAQINVVPIPAGLPLLATGAAALGLIARRRRNKG